MENMSEDELDEKEREVNELLEKTQNETEALKRLLSLLEKNEKKKEGTSSNTFEGNH
jgi:hypothetical protein